MKHLPINVFIKQLQFRYNNVKAFIYAYSNMNRLNCSRCMQILIHIEIKSDFGCGTATSVTIL